MRQSRLDTRGAHGDAADCTDPRVTLDFVPIQQMRVDATRCFYAASRTVAVRISVAGLSLGSCLKASGYHQRLGLWASRSSPADASSALPGFSQRCLLRSVA